MPNDGIETTLRTLLRSANPEATRLLVIALESPEPTLRVGAVRALALRPDRTGHRALVEHYPKLTPDARAALAEVLIRSPLVDSLLGMVSEAAPRLARRVIQLAADYGVIDMLPHAAEAAMWPNEFANAIAGDVLRLAFDLESAMLAYDPAAAAKSKTAPIDPAFARRAAVNVLNGSLARYTPEQPPELLQALLLLVPGDEPALWDALNDTTHPAHKALQNALRTSRCRGALAILARALSDTRSPRSILAIAAERADVEGLETLLGLIGHPAGLSVREGCRRVECFAWLEEERLGVLAELSDTAQATAIEMAAASGTPSRLVAGAICRLVPDASPQTRLACARAIAMLPDHLGIEPLRAVLKSDDPEAVAVAAGMLREKNFPGAMGVLLGLLEHPDMIVRMAAQRALSELTVTAFREQLDELPKTEQSRVGRLVGKADPLAVASIQAELHCGAVERRLGGLHVAELMDLLPQVASSLDKLLSDQDAGVRCEAARLLVHAEPTRERMDKLYEALSDPSAPVRDAAEKSLAALAAPVGRLPAVRAETTQ